MIMKLNKRQKTVIRIFLVIFVISFLFLPSRYGSGERILHAEQFKGYSFILGLSGDIHIPFLLAEWLLFLILAIGLCLLLKDE